MPKIALCLPTGDLVHTDFAVSLFGIRLVANHQFMVVNARTSIIEQSRFIIAREALRLEADYLFWIDSDISFPDDALMRLLEHDKDVVGASYIRRREPYQILGFGVDDIDPGTTGLVEMVRMPLGFMLIKSKVFSDIPKPWFQPYFQEDKEIFHSEDYVFCDEVTAAGYKIYCDLDLSHDLGHTGAQTFHWGRVET